MQILKIDKISPSFLSLEFFCKNSVYLRVRLRERFVNPQLLKQLAVYKIKEQQSRFDSSQKWNLKRLLFDTLFEIPASYKSL